MAALTRRAGMQIGARAAVILLPTPTRRACALALALALAPAMAPAQPTATDEPAYEPDQSQPPVIVTEGIEAARGSGAVLRGLDKVTGRTSDIVLGLGEQARFGRLEVRLGECRYPSGNPSADAYAQLVITDLVRRQTVFSGWMIASSPALSALDDARYDIWVVSCNG